MTIDQWSKFVRSLVGDTQAEAILRSRDAGKIIALAKSKGFSFTEADLSDVMARSGELADEALEQVSGAMTLKYFPH